MADLKGRRVRDFFALEARTLLERYQVIETLLPHGKRRGASHAGEEGRHIEALLRDFLNKHLPANVRALSGFILRPATKIGEYDLSRVESHEDAHSRQLDIIVYDVADFPIYERFEEFVIVPPEGVLGIISVKKTLYRSQLAGELTSLGQAQELCDHPHRRAPYSAIFSFALERGLKKNGGKTCFEELARHHQGELFDRMPTEICAFQDFVVFKFRQADSDLPGHAKYVEVDTRDQVHIGLQRMLNSVMSVYYDETRQTYRRRPGFVSFEKGVFSDATLLGHVAFRERPETARPKD